MPFQHVETKDSTRWKEEINTLEVRSEYMENSDYSDYSDYSENSEKYDYLEDSDDYLWN